MEYKVAILLNKDRSKLRVITKKLLHRLYPTFGQLDRDIELPELDRDIVLPEFDSFAEVLDPKPLFLSTEEAIPWDRLSECNLLIWEWGWTAVPPATVLEIRERMPDLKIILFTGPLDRFWRELDYRNFELHLKAANASHAVGVMLRDMQSHYAALLPHAFVFHMPVPVDSGLVGIERANPSSKEVFLGAPVRFTGIATQLPINTFLTFRRVLESDGDLKAVCFAYGRNEESEAEGIIAQLGLNESVRVSRYMRPLFRFLRSMAGCGIGIHLPHSFVQGRLALMASCVGLPMILSNDSETHRYLYPGTTVRWYDVAAASELARRLLTDADFYYKTAEVARARLRYYSVEQCAARMRNALDVVSGKPAERALR